jgi:hypothetical protein
MVVSPSYALNLLGDENFAGRKFEAALREDLGIYLIRPDRRNDRPGTLARCRQWIEAVFDTPEGQLTLEADGGRTHSSRGPPVP